jgi:hypothetical protein
MIHKLGIKEATVGIRMDILNIMDKSAWIIIKAATKNLTSLQIPWMEGAVDTKTNSINPSTPSNSGKALCNTGKWEEANITITGSIDRTQIKAAGTPRVIICTAAASTIKADTISKAHRTMITTGKWIIEGAVHRDTAKATATRAIMKAANKDARVSEITAAVGRRATKKISITEGVINMMTINPSMNIKRKSLRKIKKKQFRNRRLRPRRKTLRPHKSSHRIRFKSSHNNKSRRVLLNKFNRTVKSKNQSRNNKSFFIPLSWSLKINLFK